MELVGTETAAPPARPDRAARERTAGDADSRPVARPDVTLRNGASTMTTANIDPALERNRAFAAAGGHEGAVVFPNLRLFVITCLDPRVDPAHFLGLEPQRRDRRPQRRRAGHPRGDQRRRVHRPDSRERPARRAAVRGRRDPPHPMRSRRARRRRVPPPVRRSGSAPTNRPCATTRSSIPPRPSPATSSASAPHPRSPRASPCPGTSTTSSRAWCRRSCPPTARETDASHAASCAADPLASVSSASRAGFVQADDGPRTRDLWLGKPSSTN